MAGAVVFTASLALNGLGCEFGWTTDGLYEGVSIAFGSVSVTVEPETYSPVHPGRTGFVWNRMPRSYPLEWWSWNAWRWGVEMPVWPLAVASGVSAAWLWRCDVRLPRPGLCPSCGYALAELAPGAKCPECGGATAKGPA